MPKITKKSYLTATGRRKTAVARVRLFEKGEGKFTVNNISCEKYFPTLELQNIVNQPIKLLNLPLKVDISIKVNGGGKHSQAESVRLGLAKILVTLNIENKKKLKKFGYLSRDARKKERKKPGLKRARRAPQWSKR